MSGNAGPLKVWGLVIMAGMLVNTWAGRPQEGMIVSALVLLTFATLEGKR